MAVGFLKLIRDTELSGFLYGLTPIAWFLTSLPAFAITAHQPPDLRRWLLLPLNIIGPALCFLNAGRLTAGLDYLWAFTSITYIFHAVSGLYLEDWRLPLPPAGNSHNTLADNVRMAIKVWNNPRRLTIRRPDQMKPTTQRQRGLFTLRVVGLILLHWVAYLAFDFGAIYALRPLPREFATPTYFHFALDRAALLRAAYCLQWAWLTYFILTVANAVCAILFVSVLQVDAPDEWPPLWGNPLEIRSIRSFWGVFWHRIGSPSQLSCGKWLSRNVLGFGTGDTLEKVFLAFFVFTVSGSVHAMTNWISRETAPVEGLFGDMRFLLLNFVGGLVELCVERLVIRIYAAYSQTKDDTKDKNAKTRGKHISWVQRVFGMLWVFLFFYSVAPPWQYPYIEDDLRSRFFPFKMKVNLQRPRPSSAA
ncbi:hypothetical protein EsH8_IV_001209 [Colletotrichum jinshuiense]